MENALNAAVQTMLSAEDLKNAAEVCRDAAERERDYAIDNTPASRMLERLAAKLDAAVSGLPNAAAIRDAALEDAALVADKASHIGILRSLEATYKADAAIEIAKDIRALKASGSRHGG